MAITIQFGENKRLYTPNMYFEKDIDDARNLVIDYSGELDADTVSTATATVENITAGTPSISSNIVTTALSAGNEGVARVELKITTSGGQTISNALRFRLKDSYNEGVSIL